MTGGKSRIPAYGASTDSGIEREANIMERPVVLITGGSRGIGAATARMAAARGYDLALTFQSDAKAADEVRSDCTRAGARCEIFQADLASPAEVGRLFEAFDATFGRLTHVVNNAGTVGKAGRLDEADPEMIRQCIDLNVTGAILVAREAVRRMSLRNGGTGGVIVNLSSGAPENGCAGEYVWYAGTKGAINAFTLGLGREVAREGLRVVAVAPGLTDTEIHARGGQPGRVQRNAAIVPVGRAAQPEEVAEVILFLMSDAASYATAAVWRVSGGR